MTEPTATTTETGNVGPKTQAALDALDEAIDKVQVFQEDTEAEDEQDAAPIWERVQRLQQKLAAAQSGTSHLPTDALTGLPVDPEVASGTLGPSDPAVLPDEAGQAPSQEEGTPNLSDNPESSQG